MKWIDLFAGGGGTTTGALMVKGVEVVAALNHDQLAIDTHAKNHPETIHFKADIREQDEKDLPQCDGIWASLECTNYSKAKGGLPRDADSRTLADEIPRYAIHCQPEIIIIENVREFMSWGPLDENGRPVSRLAGSDYINWISKMKGIGYVNYDYRLLNSADYGASTSRTRYFGIFTKKNVSIKFPHPTHSKVPGLLDLKPWVSCKDKIDLNNKGRSIFNRKKALSKNTLKRIATGIKKFGGEDFIMKYYGNGDNVSSLDEPLHTITCRDTHALVSVKQFIIDYCRSDIFLDLENPMNTILTWQTKQLVSLTDSDIKIRFLSAKELARITGFPDDYKWSGNQKKQIKMIGNAVVPIMSKVLIETMLLTWEKQYEQEKIAV